MPGRREPWGDEREERDADETVAEFAQNETVQRKWHDHPTVVPFKVIARFIGRSGKRIGVTIAGFALLIAGAAMLVLPGPGWVAIFAGLAILATEYIWARRLLNYAKRKVGEAKNAVLRKKKPEEPEPES
jgi:uncharacterized protein (TIGR02611 family)